jgi:hypothetical protein
VRTLAVVLLAALFGIALGAGATAAIVKTNAPDKSVEATFKANDVKERDIVPYGQR